MFPRLNVQIQGKKWEANWNASNETPWYEGLFKSLEKDVSGLCITVNYESSFSNKLKAVEIVKLAVCILFDDFKGLFF